MGWLIELMVQAVADLFGHTIGRKRPWWVEIVATLGCLVILGIGVLILYLLFS